MQAFSCTTITPDPLPARCPRPGAHTPPCVCPSLQGGIIGSALIALGLALCGAFLWLLKHLSPLTIGVNISILGLSLYANGWPTMGTCIQVGPARCPLRVAAPCCGALCARGGCVPGPCLLPSSTCRNPI